MNGKKPMLALAVLMALGTLLVASHAARAGDERPPANGIEAGVPAPDDDPEDFAALPEFDPLGGDDVDAGMAQGPGMGPGPMGGFAGRGRGMGPRMGRRGMRGGFGPMLAAELNLTSVQKERMQELREQHQRQVIQTQADLRLAGLDLRKLMRADNPDRRAIESQIDRISGLRASIAKSRTGMMLDARSLLTAEQKKKLEELRSTRPLRRAVGRERGDDGAPGRGRGAARPAPRGGTY